MTSGIIKKWLFQPLSYECLNFVFHTTKNFYTYLQKPSFQFSRMEWSRPNFADFILTKTTIWLHSIILPATERTDILTWWKSGTNFTTLHFRIPSSSSAHLHTHMTPNFVTILHSNRSVGISTSQITSQGLLPSQTHPSSVIVQLVARFKKKIFSSASVYQPNVFLLSTTHSHTFIIDSPQTNNQGLKNCITHMST